jgi:MarC family membrane protein
MLGITLSAFQLAGGLLLLLLVLDMLRGQRSLVQETPEGTKEGLEKIDIVLTPLAIPMLAGPGAISTVMLLETHAQKWGARAILYGCIALVVVISYGLFALAVKRTSWLRQIAMKITIRLMGLLLAALAIQFMFNAIREAFGVKP